jgi:hypothetical protein
VAPGVERFLDAALFEPDQTSLVAAESLRCRWSTRAIILLYHSLLRRKHSDRRHGALPVFPGHKFIPRSDGVWNGQRVRCLKVEGHNRNTGLVACSGMGHQRIAEDVLALPAGPLSR